MGEIVRVSFEGSTRGDRQPVESGETPVDRATRLLHELAAIGGSSSTVESTERADKIITEIAMFKLSSSPEDVETVEHRTKHLME